MLANIFCNVPAMICPHQNPLFKGTVTYPPHEVKCTNTWETLLRQIHKWECRNSVYWSMLAGDGWLAKIRWASELVGCVAFCAATSRVSRQWGQKENISMYKYRSFCSWMETTEKQALLYNYGVHMHNQRSEATSIHSIFIYSTFLCHYM